MSYSEFLSNAIKGSGYSLRQLSNICRTKYNVDVTPSYISILQKDKQTPASDKVNTALAKACHINPEDLIFEAELERAPESVKQVIDTLITFIKGLLTSTIPNISFKDKQEEEKALQELNRQLNMSTREFVQSMFSEENIQYQNPFEIDLNSLSKKDTTNEIEPNIENLFMKLSVGITMSDNSMFPTIKEGAKIELVKLDEYSNGDIVVAEIQNGKSVIRTYVDTGKQIILIPINTDFETLTLDKREVRILGKVKSATTEF